MGSSRMALCAKSGREQLQQGVFTDFRRAAQIDRVPISRRGSARGADPLPSALPVLYV